ncbi:MAG: thiamine pyrophosphate-dependent enzyme [Terriglobia bacterium]
MAYGLPGVALDGNDVIAIHAAVEEAVLRARSGAGRLCLNAVLIVPGSRRRHGRLWLSNAGRSGGMEGTLSRSKAQESFIGGCSLQ